MVNLTPLISQLVLLSHKPIIIKNTITSNDNRKDTQNHINIPKTLERDNGPLMIKNSRIGLTAMTDYLISTIKMGYMIHVKFPKMSMKIERIRKTSANS